MATEAMVVHCWDTLSARLRQLTPPRRPAFADAVAQHPFFVTWDIDGDRLRGCIGCLSALPLASLGEYALKASLEDRRFKPVVAEELRRMTCKVSLLTNYEDASDWRDWTVGLHGILINFSAGGRSYSATFLPDVMPAQGWDVRAAVLAAVKKSGYDAPVTAELLATIRLQRYQSSIAGPLDFAAWQALTQSPALF